MDFPLWQGMASKTTYNGILELLKKKIIISKAMKDTTLAIFEGKQIRKSFHNDEWWFVVNDVIDVLTDSKDSAQYFKRLKIRDKELAELIDQGGVHFVPPLMLEIETAGGRQRAYCWNTSGIFRLIQSIPSPKAEPFKRWLAKVGYERLQEIQNPELAAQRARAMYRAKGYPEAWIEKRMRGIEVRETLTNEWQKRGAKKGIEYAILTNDILMGTFEMNADEYKKLKGLKRENLRDHMDDIEIILTMLGEATTTRLSQDRDSSGFPELQKDARDGGAVAGRTRKDIESKSGKKVVTKKNYLGRSKKSMKKLKEQI